MKRLVTAVVVALTLFMPSTASADAISMDFTGTGKGASVNINGLGWVFAGELNWTLDGADKIVSFCTDLNSWLGDPQTAFAESIANLSGASNDAGEKVGFLYNYYDERRKYASTSYEANALAAATQVAIWTILEGSAFQLLGSTIGDLQSRANSLVALAVAQYSSGNTAATWLNVDPLDAGRYKGQDQVTRVVPEPGTLLLLGVGALAIATRRRMTRNAA